MTALITSYNYGRFLREAIDSALAQTYPRVEVVVVDDGSSDDSREVIRGYGDRVRAILKENGGQASAWNAGVAAAQGEIICFLDSDDAWFPGKVAAVVEKYREAPFGLVCHRLEERCEPGCRVSELPHEDELWSGEIFERLRAHAFAPWPFSAPTGMAVPADVAARIFPLPEREWRLWCDTPLAYAASYLRPVGAIEAALGIYRVHGRNGHAPDAATEESRRVFFLDLAERKLLYLRRFVQAQGGSLDPDPREFYGHFREWSLIATPFPLGRVAGLWRRGLWRHRRLRSSRAALLWTLARDALVLGVVTAGLSPRYRRLRRLYRQRVAAG